MNKRFTIFILLNFCLPMALFSQLRPNDRINSIMSNENQELIEYFPESFSWINWTKGELITEYKVAISYDDPNIGRTIDNATTKLKERMRQYVLSTALEMQLSSVFIVDNYFTRDAQVRAAILSSLYELPIRNSVIRNSFMCGTMNFPLFGTNGISEPFYKNIQTYKITNFIQRETAGSQYYDTLIIDTVMFPQYKTSLMPRIVNEKGAVIHSVETVDPKVLHSQGSVFYVSSLTEALNHKSRGSRVAYIFPKNVQGTVASDLVLFDSDVERIFSQKRSVDSFYKGKVIIIKPQKSTDE